MRGLLLPRQTYEQPAVPTQADYDFTTMTTAEFNQIFTNQNGITLVEGTGAVCSSTGGHASGTKITENGSQFTKLECYMSGARNGSAGVVSGLNNTFQGTTTNDWGNLLLNGWTYTSSNTSRRVATNLLYNASSGHAQSGHQMKITIDLTTGAWEMLDNGTSYQTGTMSSSVLSTLVNGLSGDIWFHICSVNRVEIYTAGWKLIP